MILLVIVAFIYKNHVEDIGEDDNANDDGNEYILENPQQLICSVDKRKSAAKCIFSLFPNFFCKFLVVWYTAGLSCVIGIIVHQKLLFMSKTHSLLVHDNNS